MNDNFKKNYKYKFHTTKLSPSYFWPHTYLTASGKTYFFSSICFLRTYSMAASAVVNSQIKFCTKQCNKWRLYQKILLYQLNSWNFYFFWFYLFLSLSHTYFNGFGHWFSWQLWHQKWKKCVTGTESLREVDLRWLYLNQI